MQNCHFYIFQEPNSFEGPPSHIQFIDMPVDSSYMDGVGTWMNSVLLLCLHGLYMDVAKMKLPSFSEPPFDG